MHPGAPAALMVSGPRLTGKSIAAEHRVVRHLWETEGARVALISKTIRNMTDGGVWSDLMEIVLPDWMAHTGMKFTSKDMRGNPAPKTDAKTRTIYFKVSNMYGGESELRLLSLEHDHQVKEKLKGTRYSCIWFSELAHFLDPNVFRVSMMQLRMFHLEPWQHLWIADTNPAEEGEDHWAYKYWYLNQLGKGDETYAKSMRLVEVFLEDNPFITPEQISFQKGLYSDDPGEYAREVEGKWTKGHGTRGKHFADLFIHSTHVVGGGEGEGDQIDVAPDTTTLYTGWDLGEVNHAAVLLDRKFTTINDEEWSVWNVLDCQLTLGEAINLTDFALDFLRKMDALEQQYKKRFKWVHWSDDTAVNVFRPTSCSYDYQEIQKASRKVENCHWDPEKELWVPTGSDREGTQMIVLNGAVKEKFSVKARVRILRRLLKEERIFISSRCQPVIDMLLNCCAGSTTQTYVANNNYKHIFDALTYPILSEAADEMEMGRRPTSTARVKSVSL